MEIVRPRYGARSAQPHEPPLWRAFQSAAVWCAALPVFKRSRLWIPLQSPAYGVRVRLSSRRMACGVIHYSMRISLCVLMLAADDSPPHGVSLPCHQQESSTGTTTLWRQPKPQTPKRQTKRKATQCPNVTKQQSRQVTKPPSATG